MEGAPQIEAHLAAVTRGHRWWEAPWMFLIESLTGMLIFGAIGGAAIVLNLITHRLDGMRIDHMVVWGLVSVEYGLFLCDLLLFWRFLWRSFQRAWGRL